MGKHAFFFRVEHKAWQLPRLLRGGGASIVPVVIYTLLHSVNLMIPWKLAKEARSLCGQGQPRALLPTGLWEPA